MYAHPAAQSDMRSGVGGAGGDADAIVRRMVTVYQSVQTLQERSEAKMQGASPGTDYIQASQLKYKRGNGSIYLYIQSNDRQIGTYEAYCSGKTITVFTGKENAYTKRAAGINLRQNLQTLSRAAESLSGTPINQMLNPVSFLSAKGMPDECKSFRLLRQETLNPSHRRAFVVTGAADENWLYGIIGARNIQFDRRAITLWIDAENSTLLLATCDLVFHQDIPQKRGLVRQSTLRFSESHSDIVLNAPLNDQEFNFDFSRHKGAVEKYQERK